MFLYNVKLVMISCQANICDGNTTAYQVQKQKQWLLETHISTYLLFLHRNMNLFDHIQMENLNSGLSYLITTVKLLSKHVLCWLCFTIGVMLIVYRRDFVEFCVCAFGFLQGVFSFQSLLKLLKNTSVNYVVLSKHIKLE